MEDLSKGLAIFADDSFELRKNESHRTVASRESSWSSRQASGINAFIEGQVELK